MLEAPLGEDWSIAVGARRSYIDAVLPFALQTLRAEVDDALSLHRRAPLLRLPAEAGVPAAEGQRDRLQLSFFGSQRRRSDCVLPNPSIDPEGRGELRHAAQLQPAASSIATRASAARCARVSPLGVGCETLRLRASEATSTSKNTSYPLRRGRRSSGILPASRSCCSRQGSTPRSSPTTTASRGLPASS